MVSTGALEQDELLRTPTCVEPSSQSMSMSAGELLSVLVLGFFTSSEDCILSTLRKLAPRRSQNLMGKDRSGVAMAGGAAAGGGLAFLLCTFAGEVQLRGACKRQASVF